MEGFKTSDMDLMNKASKLFTYEEYIKIREKYVIKNPKQFVLPDTHRRIMEAAIKLAKNVIDRGGTDEEVKNACLYFYICTEAKKYHLHWHKARKDLKIDEMANKYQIQ